MLERRELDERIAEIKNKRNQTEAEIVKLAAYIIARDELDGNGAVRSYGDAAPSAPAVETRIGEYGDSEFLQVIAGKDASDVWAVIDETMAALKLTEPRLYAGVLRKIGY